MSGYTDQQALNQIALLLSGGVPISELTTSSPTHGGKDVATAGTAVALASSTDCRVLVIQAKPGNTGNIYVGDSGVSSSAYGFVLTAGESIPLVAPTGTKLDIAEHFIDSDNNGEGVTFMYWG